MTFVALLAQDGPNVLFKELNAFRIPDCWCFRRRSNGYGFCAGVSAKKEASQHKQSNNWRWRSHLARPSTHK
jgi:hypothetical protein